MTFALVRTAEGKRRERIRPMLTIQDAEMRKPQHKRGVHSVLVIRVAFYVAYYDKSQGWTGLGDESCGVLAQFVWGQRRNVGTMRNVEDSEDLEGA